MRLRAPALLLIALFLPAWSPAQPKISIIAPATVRGGEGFNVNVQVENLPGIDAFGFELRFNENLLTFDSITSVKKGNLTEGFAGLMANTVAPGSIRVGGYGLTPTQATAGTLCQLFFTAKLGVEDSLVLDIRGLIDFPQAPLIVPALINVKKEPPSNSGMSAGDARGRRGRTVTLSVEAALPNGNSVRGAATQLVFDPSVLTYIGTDKAGSVPADYQATGSLSGPGTGVLNLSLDTGSTDLSSGDLWKVQFDIQGSAPHGRSTVAITQASSFFLVLPGNAQAAVASVRNGSVSVFPTGDANRSGAVTVADVVTVALASMYPSAYANEFTDCNTDNATNSLDVTCTINALFGRLN